MNHCFIILKTITSTYFIIYLLCNPDISHLITYSTLSGNWDSTSFFRRRSKKGLKTLCKRRIIKIVSSSFNSTFSPWKNINQIKASLLFNNLYSQIIQKQFKNWIWIIGTIFRVFRPSFRVWDHSFKTSDNFRDFWPLHPYHWHSSKMLMKGIFDPYVLWPFNHRHMGIPPHPKICWRLKWMLMVHSAWNGQ